MTLLLRLLVNAAALWMAARLVDGLSYTGDWPGLVIVALIFGVVNTCIRPILSFFALPLQLLTLGLFTLVLNAGMLWLTAWASTRLGLGFHVYSLRAAVLGALLVSVLSTVLSWVLIPDEDEE